MSKYISIYFIALFLLLHILYACILNFIPHSILIVAKYKYNIKYSIINKEIKFFDKYIYIYIKNKYIKLLI